MRKTTTTALLLIILALTLILTPTINQTKAQTQPTVNIIPSNIQASQNNQLITFNITISNVQNLWGWSFDIVWNPQILTYIGYTEGDFLTQIGQTIPIITAPPINGTLDGCSDTLETISGASGNGLLLQLQLEVTNTSFTTTTLNLNNIQLSGVPPSAGYLPPPITPSSTTTSATITYSSGGAPSAYAGADQTVQVGTKVTLDGSQSLSSGTNPTYTWNFTDNGSPQTLTGQTATYTFNTPGVYHVTLTLTDSNGNSTSPVTIKVQNTTPPVAKVTVEDASNGQTISSGQTVSTSQTLIFNGTSSYESNNGTIAKYVWQTNDGDANDMNEGLDLLGVIGTNATLTYSFNQGATKQTTHWNVTLTVFDPTGLNNTAFVLFNVTQGGAPSSTPSASTAPTTAPTQTPTSSDTPTTTPIDPGNNNPTPNTQTSPNIPSGDLAIVILVTIAVLGGSVFWLRKRT